MKYVKVVSTNPHVVKYNKSLHDCNLTLDGRIENSKPALQSYTTWRLF